jgi:arylsulfatase A-like enzyme
VGHHEVPKSKSSEFKFPTCKFLLCATLCASALAATAHPGTAAQAGNTAPPNIILITLDTTRADRMGFLGSTRGLTPSLDALAHESVVFTRAYAQAPLTTVSHASILTGTYPQFHQVLDFEYPLPKDLPYAPQILHARGYHTAAFLSSMALDAAVSAPGFDRGFDTYNAPFHAEGASESSHLTRRRGADVVAQALGWLNQHPRGPFFLWVHLFDAHDPYQPPEPYKTRYRSEPYDGSVAYEDSVVGTFLQQLKARGLYDGAIIAVMADHGESLGAHGEDTHGIFLYDETIRVPLLIKLPDQGSAGKRIEDRAELVDVMPTILQAAGIDIPKEVQGASLLGLMQSKADDAGGPSDAWRDRPAYAQTDYPRAWGWSPLQSLRTGKYLYIQAPHRELYDESADPTADHNLAPEKPAVANTLGNQLQHFRQTTARLSEAAKPSADPDAEEKLAELGYVSARDFPEASSAKDARAQEFDPKDHIALVKDMDRVISLTRTHRFHDAISALQPLIASNPGVAMFYFSLGDCYMGLHEYDKAVPVLRQAEKLAPGSTVVHAKLGQSFEQLQDFAAAIPEVEEVVSAMPHSQQWRLELANDYVRSNRLPQAAQEYERVLGINPNDYDANLLLGRLRLLSGDAASAVSPLKKAVAVHPEDASPHRSLAYAYFKLGEKAEAAHERLEASRLEANNH